METKAWIIFIIAVIVIAILAVAVIDPGFKDGLVTGLAGIGGSVWTGVYDGWNSLAGTVGASGAYFALWTVLGVVFGWQLLGRIFSVVKTKLLRTPVIPKAPVYVPQSNMSTPELYTPTEPVEAKKQQSVE